MSETDTKCHWKPSKYIAYDTDCGEKITSYFIDFICVDNFHLNFCPNCGKPVDLESPDPIK